VPYSDIYCHPPPPCTDSLWWTNWFFLYLPWQRQFMGDYYGADWKCPCFHL
jgi:hypothetical protein